MVIFHRYAKLHEGTWILPSQNRGQRRNSAHSRLAARSSCSNLGPKGALQQISGEFWKLENAQKDLSDLKISKVNIGIDRNHRIYQHTELHQVQKHRNSATESSCDSLPGVLHCKGARCIALPFGKQISKPMLKAGPLNWPCCWWKHSHITLSMCTKIYQDHAPKLYSIKPCPRGCWNSSTPKPRENSVSPNVDPVGDEDLNLTLW